MIDAQKENLNRQYHAKEMFRSQSVKPYPVCSEGEQRPPLGAATPSYFVNTAPLPSLSPFLGASASSIRPVIHFFVLSGVFVRECLRVAPPHGLHPRTDGFLVVVVVAEFVYPHIRWCL